MSIIASPDDLYHWLLWCASQCYAKYSIYPEYVVLHKFHCQYLTPLASMTIAEPANNTPIIDDGLGTPVEIPLHRFEIRQGNVPISDAYCVLSTQKGLACVDVFSWSQWKYQ